MQVNHMRFFWGEGDDMKKSIILLVLVFVFLITGCSKMADPVSAEQFYKTMTDEGLKVDDETQGYTDEAYSHINKILIAYDDGNYQIEFYDMDNALNAEQLFKTNKMIIESESAGRLESSVSMGEYKKYQAVSSDNKWRMAEQIGNTVVNVSADDGYKETVEKYLSSINY